MRPKIAPTCLGKIAYVYKACVLTCFLSHQVGFLMDFVNLTENDIALGQAKDNAEVGRFLRKSKVPAQLSTFESELLESYPGFSIVSAPRAVGVTGLPVTHRKQNIIVSHDVALFMSSIHHPWPGRVFTLPRKNKPDTAGVVHTSVLREWKWQRIDPKLSEQCIQRMNHA